MARFLSNTYLSICNIEKLPNCYAKVGLKLRQILTKPSKIAQEF